MEKDKELQILREMVKLAIIVHGVKLSSRNEFVKSVNRLALVLGEKVADVEVVIIPIIEDIFSDMIYGRGEEDDSVEDLPGI